MTDISNYDEVIDSRDVIEALEEYEEIFESEYEDYKEEFREEFDGLCANGEIDENEVEFEEWLDNRVGVLNFDDWKLEHIDYEDYKNLLDFANEAKDYNSDWIHGATLIRYSQFEDYVKEFCNECGYISRHMPNFIEIDWSATAENMKDDYTEVDFDGVTYYILCN